jgi:hypothetical protein
MNSVVIYSTKSATRAKIIFAKCSISMYNDWGKSGHSIYSKFISLIFEDQQKTSMRLNEKILAPLSLIFLSSGCIPAYFHSMLCAMSLWMIGFAIMNIHVFVLSRKKF